MSDPYDHVSDVARFHKVKAVPCFLFLDEGAVVGCRENSSRAQAGGVHGIRVDFWAVCTEKQRCWFAGLVERGVGRFGVPGLVELGDGRFGVSREAYRKRAHSLAANLRLNRLRTLPCPALPLFAFDSCVPFSFGPQVERLSLRDIRRLAGSQAMVRRAYSADGIGVF